MSGLGMSILEEGRVEGRVEGREEGRVEGREAEVFESVQEEDYSIERGAQKLHLTIEQFEEKMRGAGYKIPTRRPSPPCLKRSGSPMTRK